MHEFWLCFVPLFVAVDAVGMLPMYLSLTDGIPTDRLKGLLYQSVITAAVVALGFVAAGTALLRLLGITVADFMVAGGILLFVIAMSDLLSVEKTQRKIAGDESFGAVPLGVPLITGPAVLTTSILLMGQHGITPTAAAIIVNVLLAGLVFFYARAITGFIGNTGTKILSKIASLFLAAIAVMMIRRGIVLFLKEGVG